MSQVDHPSIELTPVQDMKLATELGKKFGSPLPLTEAAEELYAAALSSKPELAKKDFSSIYQFLSGGTTK